MANSLHSTWISLKDAASFFESQGIAKEQIQRGLIAGVIKGSGVVAPDGKSYTGIQVQAAGLVDWLALVQLENEEAATDGSSALLEGER